MHLTSLNRLVVFASLMIAASQITQAQAPATAGQFLISEFRLRGPNGATDEFIEIVNNTGVQHIVTAASGTGYGIAASDGVTRCTIPNGTTMTPGRHFLCVNSAGFSLGDYPAATFFTGTVTTATGDATYTTDIPDNAGIALFNNNTGGASYSLANRIDAVGSTAETNAIYKEGTGYPALTPLSLEYSFVRDACGKQGSTTIPGPCPSGGSLVDTDNNATNFFFVGVNGISVGAGQRLGAPGPETLFSVTQRNSQFGSFLVDGNVSAASPPNRVRNLTSNPANNSTFGTLSIRRRWVNNTGLFVGHLRFRVVDISTFPAPPGSADLRPINSVTVIVHGITDSATCAAKGTPNTPPCSVTIEPTSIEQPPSQPNGGGFNSSIVASQVRLGRVLGNGQSIILEFLFGVQQPGAFKFYINVEANSFSIQP